MNVKSTLHDILPYLLKPLSWIYGGITALRNWLFDKNVLPVEEFDVPVVSVGNLTAGGTGKTPHVEYIAGMLSASYKIAVLSRGYKRKTRGFLLANDHSTPESVGDEPLQIYLKLGPRVKVAVCENRRKGIKELIRLFPDIQLVILDDAFQHRYVKPKINILLMDYARPTYKDALLPLGRLRENAHQISRADMVVVTKCPENLPPIQYRIVSKYLDLRPYQKLYFSSLSYGVLTPVFPNDHPYTVELGQLNQRDSVLLVTGIANPRGFIRHFRHYPFRVKIAHFPDHHDFSRADVEALQKMFSSLKGERKIIITTEKDAVRLAYNPYFPVMLKQSTYFIPVRVRMLEALDDKDFIHDLINESGK